MIFKTERPNDYAWLGILLLRFLVGLSLCSLGFYLVNKAPITPGDFTVVFFVLTVTAFIPEITKERILQIVIDDTHSITFTYKALFANLKQETIDTENLSIEIAKSRFSKLLFTKNTALVFTVNNKERFMVSRYKDGFSVNSLQQICACFLNTPVPILQ